MKLGLYWSYATRSLIRGGQRTVLAIFCVAVGVMAIVVERKIGRAKPVDQHERRRHAETTQRNGRAAQKFFDLEADRDLASGRTVSLDDLRDELTAP